MSLEFPQVYAEIFADVHAKYQKELESKRMAIAKGEEAAKTEAAREEEVKI